MKVWTVIGAAIVFALTSPGAGAQDARAQVEAIVKNYLASHPEELGEIVKGYFIKHPEAVGQILAEILKRQPGAAGKAAGGTAIDRSAVIAGRSAALFELVAPGHARRPPRRHNAGRVLRLQLRLLPARAGGYAPAAQG